MSYLYRKYTDLDNLKVGITEFGVSNDGLTSQSYVKDCGFGSSVEVYDLIESSDDVGLFSKLEASLKRFYESSK